MQCLSFSYRQAQASVLEAIPQLHKLGVKTKRPEDYFAEMAKTDAHMKRVYAIHVLWPFPSIVRTNWAVIVLMYISFYITLLSKIVFPVTHTRMCARTHMHTQCTRLHTRSYSGYFVFKNN